MLISSRSALALLETSRYASNGNIARILRNNIGKATLLPLLGSFRPRSTFRTYVTNLRLLLLPNTVWLRQNVLQWIKVGKHLEGLMERILLWLSFWSFWNSWKESELRLERSIFATQLIDVLLKYHLLNRLLRTKFVFRVMVHAQSTTYDSYYFTAFVKDKKAA